ncbi:MAG: hypothetical protein WDO68_24285 [Gammaproteobacteria bacterium]
MDHRWGQRVGVDLAVQLLCHPRTVAVGRLMDVSVSGAYVRTGLVPALLAPVRILGFLSEHEGMRREAIEGYVVRRERGGFGIEWFELAPAGVCRFLIAGIAGGALEEDYEPARSRVIRAAGSSPHRVVF